MKKIVIKYRKKVKWKLAPISTRAKALQHYDPLTWCKVVDCAPPLRKGSTVLILRLTCFCGNRSLGVMV